MRRVRFISSVVVLAALVVGAVPFLTPAAGAQTGDLTAFCAARIEANGAETKAENIAVIQKVLAVAPPAIVPVLEEMLAGVKKKGNKYFDSEEGFGVLSQADTFVYENCPGTSVPVTAIDYEFQGVPATLPAGVAKFAFTNEAPKEPHEMIIFKLNEKGAAMAPEDLLALPQGKAQKMIDPSTQIFLFAPPGQTFYGISELTPGDYLYACFFPVGGKETKKATSHWTEGMYGTFTVA